MRRVLLAVLGLGFVLMGWGVVQAQPMMGKWWDIPEIREKIQLTQEQHEKMEKIFNESQMGRRDLIQKAKTSEETLNGLLRRVDLDTKAFDEELSRLISLRNETYQGMVRMKLDIRGILNQQQIEILLQEDPSVFDLGRGWAEEARRAWRQQMRRPIPE